MTKQTDKPQPAPKLEDDVPMCGRQCPRYGDFDACPDWSEGGYVTCLPAVRALKADNERLRAIVDRLRHTADGVPVTPGMTIYNADGTAFWSCPDIQRAQQGVDPTLIGFAFDYTYSTREAVQAAKDGAE